MQQQATKEAARTNLAPIERSRYRGVNGEVA